ncbi:MAG: FkbM family methyltransferase [Bacteroidales bacterium]|nr:FkbM family methyltransferase [Bacteroidales bacterium]
MKTIRKIIYSILGLRGYLRLISKVYICMIRWGMLKSKYPELFFLKKIVKRGDTCLDIGANVGYYSHFLCKYAGVEGRVYAVEPIPDFRVVLMKNIPSNCRNHYVLFPYALGSEEKKIQMGLPVVGGVIHHGMTHVLDKNEGQTIAKTFEVEMKVPDKLFSDIQKLDFVKCDVEGFEYYVFSNMQETFKKHKPVIQCELGGEQKKATLNLMKSLGYLVYALDNDQLKPLSDSEALQYSNDVYFVHHENRPKTF